MKKDIDVRPGFVTVPHSFFLMKLPMIGYAESTMDLVVSHLSVRTTKVIKKCIESIPKLTIKGVPNPQGGQAANTGGENTH